ncbi:uncharacterized protein N7503_009382 [Penicillium pulvis]|uniref:uncharacterized protein n=1 Tax=Penicillium pulvis TaxID=1562058 RepID=UPI002547AF99|nr:uncharacterized protein N7503_009382 [Penicillium pulvis]KAJ5793404.1 hypothetical protein N7503_009382 [Penicillium pulvis]
MRSKGTSILEKWREPAYGLYRAPNISVSADPGYGKSVLSQSIVEDCLENSYPKVTIYYFFFKDNDEQNHLDLALYSVLH